MTTSQDFKALGYGRRHLQGHEKRIFSLSWCSSGRKLASGSADNCIHVWTLEPYSKGVSEKEEGQVKLKGHSGPVGHLQWKPGSESVLASVGSDKGDKTLRFWDVKSNTKACTSVVNLSDSNLSLTWSPDGNNVAAIDINNTLSIVDVRKSKVVRTQKFNSDVYSIQWSPDSPQHMLVAGGRGSVEVVSLTSMETVWSLRGHSATAYSMALSSNRKWLVSGGADAMVALWDLDDMVCVRTWAHMDYPVRSVSVSHDAQYVAYASEGREVEVLSLRTGERLESIAIRSACDCVAWNPVHNVLAYCDETLETRDAPAHHRDYRGMPDYRQQQLQNSVCIFAPPKP